MNTKNTRQDAAPRGPDDTAELPALKLDKLRDNAELLDSTDSWASTDSWKLGPEQQRDLEREAELGTLRSNLASMAESRGYLENSLRSLTMSLRDLEERLLAKASQTSTLENNLRAREAEVADLTRELEAVRVRWSDGQAERAALLQQQQALQETVAARTREIESLHAARSADQEAQQAMLLEHEAREAELARAQLQVAALQASSAARTAELERVTAELAETTQRSAALQAELAEQRRTAAAEGDALRAELQQLRATQANEQQQAAARHEELRALHDTARERGDTLQQALGALEAGHAELRAQHDAVLAGADDLRSDLREQLDMIRSLNEQLDQARRERELAVNDLKIAEERIRAADVELRNRDSRIEKLGASERDQKARAENFARRLAERDGLIQRLEHEAESSAAVLGKIQSNLARLDKDESSLPHDLVARLLVRNDGNTEIVQVLGRRTLIGRGVDCQLQIDADFVSRRHALVTVMPDETVIEDLNSTNGVFVNGTRVARRKLAEGDNITIGKTVFRYVLKQVADRGA